MVIGGLGVYGVNAAKPVEEARGEGSEPAVILLQVGAGNLVWAVEKKWRIVSLMPVQVIKTLDQKKKN